ncbi:ABC transporter ATP-binding protein [bacterium E08(2017)]|nr:ABC transporter ATP-binding protein [bacterium E08(2017)]
MALVTLRSISLGYGERLLLDNVDLNIEPGDRACLVGRNGTGKTSFMKLLHGDEDPDSGDIQAYKDTRISYLPQDVPSSMDGTIEDIAGSWIKEDHAYSHGWDKHHAVGRILSHLSLDGHAMFNELSGGQKRRTLLARALACDPDLLLLDEPTNHLDIASICWLEEYLLRECKTFLFVTHDRAFLRRVANRIIDLDRGIIADWACDYDTYLRRKSDLLHDESVQNERFDKLLSKEEAWIRQGIKARRTRDEGRVKQLMKMREERRERRGTEGTARLSVQGASRSGNKVIDAVDISFGYNEQETIVNDFSTRIMRGDKVGVIGANGTGKTTLLKLFAGELTPDTGEVMLGANLEVAYFDQHRAVLNDNETVVENIGRGKDTIKIDGRDRNVIGYLQDFLFTPARAQTPVHVLSGGERNRLLLAMLFAKPSNLLIMDEPTNDLDTETLELLEEQLINYNGTILMVSHDRAFLDNVVTSVIAMEGKGVVREMVGGYKEYEQAKQAELPAKKEKKAAPQKPKTGKRFGYKENREYEALPGKIEKLETEQEALHEKMTESDYYKQDPADIASDNNRAREIVEELEECYTRWEELEELKG